jgi:hypothetical protein
MPSSPYITVPRITIEATGPAPPWLGELEERVNHLLALGPDWDTYGAEPIRLDHMLAALRLLATIVDAESPMPAVVPTAARGVQIEWQTERGAVEARVGDDGVRVYVQDDAGETEGEVSQELVSRAAHVIGSTAPVA